MRYEDASGAFQASGPIANDDADTLSAGERGPATGNLITGEGTQYGSAGADSAAGAKITAIAGKGGEDTTLAAGKLSVEGEHGRLTVDADGNYSYMANANVENVRDRFTYTLADNAGNSDTAALIVEIGKTPAVIKANAQQIVPGPDGVVTLPPGVELSDVRVVGRNLVVDLPDGTQLIIIDGAIFVPQLVLGGVEVPATNVAALLIGQEVQPAAGEIPPSSGGNFALPPPPLDPGIPLGDLIPPTELNYVPPEPQEVFPEEDNEEPEIFVQPDGQPASIAAVDQVEEAGLPTRNGNLPGEPAGSGESADGNGADNDVTSETTTGNIVYDSPDGVDSITLNGVVITTVGQVIPGAFGDLTITSIAPGVIGYSYTLDDNTSGNDTHDDFQVILTDSDGDQASATLRIDIVDDVPTARPDTDLVPSGQYGPVTGNVITDASAGDAGDSDSGADTVGADNATVTAVSSANVPANSDSSAPFSVNGQYGVLTLQSDGSYSYVRNPGTPGGVNDVFNYTLTDGDGDTSTTTLTISIGDAAPQTAPNPLAQLDDDALAGGISGGVGDDPDAANLSGNLQGIGGDGPLTFDLLLTGAPGGFSYVDGPNGAVHVMQGTTHVLTVTINATTGAYTISQVNPIDHPAGGDENNVQFTINYQVRDQDGDTADGTLNIDVDDDTPEMNRADVSLPTLTVDETDLTTNATGNVSVVFAGAYGADGPGTTVYAVSTVNGTDSGLVDVGTGLPVLLYNIGGQVVGSTSATLAGVTAGNTVFTVAIDANTGVVTLDQIRALDHPANPNPNDPVSPAATSIQATATITDGDGDPASLSVNIGASLVFLDDGPSVDITLSAAAEPVLLTQDTETDGTPTTQDSATASFAANFSVVTNFGADGAGTQSVSYALGISAPGVDSGLDQGGNPIFLHLIGGVVVGSTSASAAGVNAGNTVFNVTVDASGNVTLTQFSQIDHQSDPSPTGAPFGDDIDSLADNLVTLTATANVTDGDGDPASDSQTLNIGAQLQFEDDGPDVAAVLTGTLLKLDETDGVGVPGEVDAPGGNLGTITVAAATLFTVNQANASPDTPTTLGYSLSLSADGVASGLLLSTTNAPIFLYNIGGVITGSTSATLAGVNVGNTAFTVSIDSGTGAVTMTQFLAVEHSNPASNDEDSSGLTSGVLSANVTATDFDGDTDSGSVDLGSIIRFEDDGPTIDVSVNGQVTEPLLVTQDSETDGVPTAEDSASSAVNFGGVFNLAFTTGSDGAPTPTLSYALGVQTQGMDSGLDSAGASIFLYNIGGLVVGSTSATEAGVNAGNTVFNVSVSGTGVVTLTQFAQIDHPIGGDPSATAAPFTDHFATLADTAVTLTASSTITDNDGDPATDSATVNIGANLRFEDDGPDVSAVLTGTLLKLDETDGVGVGAEVDAPGGNLGTVTVNAASLVTVSQPNVSADAPTTLAYSLVLSSDGVASGLQVSSNNAPIFLYNISGVITGSTSATLAGVNAGNTAFTVSVDSGSGAVTMTQFLAIEHPIPGASHDEDSLPLAGGVLNLRVTATDFDGDTDFAQVDLGSVIRFEDDGPTAQNDVDTIVGGNGPATGNVLTGVDFGGGDLNSTDGTADNVGSDTPGSITAIASVNVPANVDTDAGPNFTIAGQYGVLTLNANGNYSYLRNDGSPGGVQDVFRYTLTDADGDTVQATLTISINDNFPNLPDPALVRLDDDVIPGAGGNLNGPADDDPDAVPGNVVNGQLAGTGGDAPLTYNFTGTNTLPLGFSIGAGSDADTLLINQGATLVMTVQLNQATGAFTVTQNAPILHPADEGGAEDDVENNLVFNIGVEVEDADGDSEPATITINVDDDTPTIDVTAGADAAVILTTDDPQTIAGASDTAVSTANFGGVFGLTQSVGADGGAAATLSYALDVTGFAGGPGGIDSGLDQGGNSIFLYEIGGKVVGSTSATLAGVVAGNTVFDVAVSNTGVVTLTQYSQIDHPIGSDPSATGSPFSDHFVSLTDTLVTLTASSTLIDNDGDEVSDSATVNIGANLRFTDDGPSAAIVTTGQGVSVDESAGVQVDSNDTTNAGVIALFSGVANVGVDPDMSAQYAQNASAVVASTGTTFGADTPGTAVFSLNVSSAGVDSGLNTTAGADIFLFKEGDLVVGRVGNGAGPAAFAIAINPSTGVVSMVEYLSIQHPNPANPDESVSIANGALLATVTATDFDGDTSSASTAIGSLISFQDAAPIMTAAQNINIQNSGDVAHTGQFAFTLGADGAAVSNDVITNVTGSATVNGNPVTNWSLVAGAENATTASYSFSFDYPVGGGNTATATGTLVFDKVAGTYTVDLANPIQGVTTILQTSQGTLFQGYEFGTSTPDGSQPEISVTQIQDLAGTANDIFVQFTSVAEPSSGTGDNALEVTNWVPGTDNPPPVNGGGDTSWSAGQLFNQDDSWVSTSNSANGVAGDTIQGGEVLDFALVQGPNPTGNLAQPGTFAQASAMFLKFDGIGTGEDMIVVLKLYDPNTNSYTTRAIMVENSDIQKGPGAGPGQFSGVTLDNNDGLVIIESNDYNNPGENWVIVGAQIAGSDEGVTGTAINLNSAIGAAGDSDVDNNGSLDTDALGFQSDTNDGPFKISSIGFLTTSTTPQNAHLDFNVTVTDGDGDSITQAIAVDVTPAADSASAATIPAGNTTVSQAPLSSKSSATVADSYQPSQQTAANNNVGNTGITSAMVAASGLAAMSMTSLNSFDQPSFGSLVQDSYQLPGAKTIVHDGLDQGVASISLGSEHGGSAFNAFNLSSSGFSFGDRGFGGGSLDAMSFGGGEPAYVPNFASGEPMVANIPAFAANVPTVSMASAEMLRAAALDGDARQGGAIEQVLADALGEQAPTIDALLANLPGGIGELAAIANLASPDGAGVPAWDVGMHGGFAPMHDMVMKVAAVALHQDAVQPA